jgi:hypothetical protein
VAGPAAIHRIESCRRERAPAVTDIAAICAKSKGINMKPNRSAASVQLRQDLARLLRRLRAVRREKRPYDQLQWRIHRALAEARRIGSLVSFSDATAVRTDATYLGTCPVGAPASARADENARPGAVAEGV